MKILTSNFVTCAVKSCKGSPEAFPLHFKDAELEQTDVVFNGPFLRNIMPRIEWEALRTTATELGFATLPPNKPEADVVPVGSETGEPMQTEEMDKLWRDLHRLLIETEVVSGKLVCANCSHEYRIKEGIANFLLPGHLV